MHWSTLDADRFADGFSGDNCYPWRSFTGMGQLYCALSELWSLCADLRGEYRKYATQIRNTIKTVAKIAGIKVPRKVGDKFAPLPPVYKPEVVMAQDLGAAFLYVDPLHTVRECRLQLVIFLQYLSL
jgi:hypothetical protein